MIQVKKLVTIIFMGNKKNLLIRDKFFPYAIVNGTNLKVIFAILLLKTNKQKENS